MPAATCTYSEPVEPGATLMMVVELEVEENAPVGAVTNVVSASGGGTAAVVTGEPLTKPNTVGEPSSAFGVSAFGMAAHDVGGQRDTQSGGHPNDVTTTLNLNTVVETRPSGSRLFASVEPPKDIAVYLPLGLLGDPTSAARCTELQLIAQGGSSETECPLTSRLGTVTLFGESSVESSTHPAGSGVSSIFNMVPEAGYPAQLGVKVLTKAVPLYVSVVHDGAGYALRVASPGIPRAINFEGLALNLFGDPRQADGDANSSQAFFTNPVDCSAGPLTARMETDSWAAPGQWSSANAIAYPKVTNCNLLQFEPTIAVHPEVTQAEEPAGYEIKIKVPQSPEHFPVLATPELKNVALTLPQGMTISPGGGDGLVGCDATGPHGIDIPSGEHAPDKAGEGEEIGPDGMSHLAPGNCPQASQIGTVEIATPLLEAPLEGRVYIAQPKCGGSGQPGCTSADATNGSLFGIYLEAEGSGVVVKLKGSVSVNPVTGQLTTKFLDNPQLPVSEVTLHIKGGGRAPLANPRQCDPATTNAALTPWSSPITPDAIALSAFPVDWDGNGAPCPQTPPFAPTLEAGETNTRAGGFGPFTLTVARGDRQQDLSRLQVKMPAGLLGLLSKVPLCEEPHAAQGTCDEASRIGTTWAAAGSGPQPLWVQGRVYLTGPYAGAPFGLSIVVPAIAGPFDLGDVVVRSRIDADRNTSALTITSDPLPQFRDGVPLRIQKLNVTVDRPGFIFNPTNCTAKQISATLESEQGASSSASTPFAVEGCRSLPFKPSFKVSTGAHASKLQGASLDVKVTSAAGQANIGKVAVKLPKQLPARLTTLQHACLAAVFESNPATCDPRSLVGVVKAKSPVLPVTLTGPAYLVSHGSQAFPDLVVVLQGEGVRIDLTGNTNIVNGITSSTFASVPDAPIESFELKLPQGPHSALTGNVRSLCGQPLKMPTTLTGQNGAQIKQSTNISVTGCPRVKRKKH